MQMSTQTITAAKPYRSQPQDLVKNYLFADSLIPYASILTGIFLYKTIYDLVHFISNSSFKTYLILTKIQRIEWNDRGTSTVHAIFITAISLHFVFWSKLFSDRPYNDLIVFRSSPLSSFGLGVVHHSLPGIAVAYSLFSGEGKLYTYMVLVSVVTTPEINMRWYLDTADMKKSNAYLINGVVIFFGWLVVRILPFIYMFYHVYLHYDQVIQMHICGYLLVFVVPTALAFMNLI